MDEEDFTGCIIEAPKGSDGHDMVIVEKWKPEKYKNMWFWKCLNCYESSGVLSATDIKKLRQRGLTANYDGEPMFEKEHPKDEVEIDFDQNWRFAAYD